MNVRATLMCLPLMLLSFAAIAGEGKTNNGAMSAVVVATSDKNWQAKLDNPAEINLLSQNEKVPFATPVTILLFVKNVPAEEFGANIRCDYTLVGPGRAHEEKNLECFKGSKYSSSNTVYMATPTLTLQNTPNDKPGKWTITVTVRDTLRGGQSVAQYPIEFLAQGR